MQLQLILQQALLIQIDELFHKSICASRCLDGCFAPAQWSLTVGGAASMSFSHVFTAAHSVQPFCRSTFVCLRASDICIEVFPPLLYMLLTAGMYNFLSDACDN